MSRKKKLLYIRPVEEKASADIILLKEQGYEIVQTDYTETYC